MYLCIHTLIHHTCTCTYTYTYIHTRVMALPKPDLKMQVIKKQFHFLGRNKQLQCGGFGPLRVSLKESKIHVSLHLLNFNWEIGRHTLCISLSLWRFPALFLFCSHRCIHIHTYVTASLKHFHSFFPAWDVCMYSTYSGTNLYLILVSSRDINCVQNVLIFILCIL